VAGGAVAGESEEDFDVSPGALPSLLVTSVLAADELAAALPASGVAALPPAGPLATGLVAGGVLEEEESVAVGVVGAGGAGAEAEGALALLEGGVDVVSVASVVSAAAGLFAPR
jgi:hypothetical protein